jgi:hypothetical protein
MQKFQNIVKEMRPQIQEWESRLLGLPENMISNRRNSQQRTIRQIVGHMVDSASNNTQRIIHLQYDPSPCRFPDYANLGNNDRWIAIQNYQKENWRDLLQLWKYTNLHVLHVMQQIDPEKLSNIWISALDQKITLEAMVNDFPRHFKLHLREIEKLMDGDNG